MENLCTCPSCGIQLDENDFVAINLEGESLCESCESSAWGHTNKVMVAHEGEITSYEWCMRFKVHVNRLTEVLHNDLQVSSQQ